MRNAANVSRGERWRPADAAAAGRADAWFSGALLLVGRLGLAYLFFTQLFWKLPPSFGCGDDFRFTTANPDGSLARTGGLCDWIGIESAWAPRPRTLFGVDLDGRGGSDIALQIGPLARANGAFLDGFVKPNIRWFGWVIWGGEAFIFVSLFLGLFSRLGALVAVGIAAQLVIGLAGIGDPYEWEWGYLTILFLAITLTGIASGRILGLDALIRPRLLAAAERGNRAARFALLLT